MQTLNFKLFNAEDEKLRLQDDVREALVDISDAFLEELQEQNIVIHPADVRIVGSNAGFDYTEHSDIDLHLVVNFEFYSCDPTILQCALNIYRQKFNQQYDITVKGINVEIYVEDIKSGNVSNGVYSLLQNRWIRFPQPEADMSEYITDEIKDCAKKWEALITEQLAKEPSKNDADVVLANAEHLLDRLYLMRKNGLESSAGRLSDGNLIFKQVRNSGMLDALKDKLTQLKSFALTLESLKR